MTIASEIIRLQGAKSDIKTSIESKGVSVPSCATLDTYSCYVDQISSIPAGSTDSYGLKSTVYLCNWRGDGLITRYSEINGDGTVTGLFSVNRAYDSYCDNMGFYFMSKESGCEPQWSCVYSGPFNDDYTRDQFYIYAHKTDPDCFLVNRAYCAYRGGGSGACWTYSYSYYRLGINFACHCMTCVGSGSRCETGQCCGSKNCDNNPPGDDYTYIGTSFTAMANCRGNKPTAILRTEIVSDEDGSWVAAAVFR